MVNKKIVITNGIISGLASVFSNFYSMRNYNKTSKKREEFNSKPRTIEEYESYCEFIDSKDNAVNTVNIMGLAGSVVSLQSLVILSACVILDNKKDILKEKENIAHFEAIKNDEKAKIVKEVATYTANRMMNGAMMSCNDQLELLDSDPLEYLKCATIDNDSN